MTAYDVPLWPDDPAPRDLAEGRRRRDVGAARAQDAAPRWHDLAMTEVRRLALSREPFTSEDVTGRVGLPRGDVAQHANNAVGAVMLAARRAGVIRRMGYTQSTRTVSHAAVISVWQGVR